MINCVPYGEAVEAKVHKKRGDPGEIRLVRTQKRKGGDESDRLGALHTIAVVSSVEACWA